MSQSFALKSGIGFRLLASDEACPFQMRRHLESPGHHRWHRDIQLGAFHRALPDGAWLSDSEPPGGSLGQNPPGLQKVEVLQAPHLPMFVEDMLLFLLAVGGRILGRGGKSRQPSPACHGEVPGGPGLGPHPVLQLWAARSELNCLS